MISYERSPAGDLLATVDVPIGPTRRHVRLTLGPWDGDDFDPAGLRGAPVVVVPDPTWTELVRRGALRAGGQPTVLLLPGDAPRMGIQLLVAHREGVDVTIVEAGGGATMTLARYLGGRPIPALPLPGRDRVEALFAGCEVDVDIAVPSLDGKDRARLRATIEPLGLHDVHHLVEVDPRPAFDDLGVAIAGASPGALTAAAAGVLAGRVSVRSRRWRDASR